MTHDLREYALIALEATWLCALDAGEALVKAVKRGWALGMARRVR